MPQPISPISSPVQEPYTYQPITAPAFHGLNVQAPMEGAAMAAAPYVAEQEKTEQMDDQATKAAKFQQHINTGLQGMQAYIDDVGKTNPDLAKQFGAELSGITPYASSLPPKDLADLSFKMHDSWNGRLGGSKIAEQMKANPNAPITDLLGSSGLDAKDMLNIKSQTEARQATADKARASAGYMNKLPELKKMIADSQANAKIRAAEISASRPRAGKAGASPAGFQYSLGVAQKNLDASQKEVEQLIQADPGKVIDPATGQPPDPNNAYMIREATLWNKHMKELIKERDGWQAKVSHAVEHGAKMGDAIEAPAEAGMGSVTAPEKPTTQSTPDDVAAYLKYNGYKSDSATVAAYQQRLKGPSGPAPAQAPQ